MTMSETVMRNPIPWGLGAIAAVLLL